MALSNPYHDLKSLPSKFRRRRFASFEKMIERSVHETGRCHILDLGGTDYYWDLHEDILARYGDKVHVYLINLEGAADGEGNTSRYTTIYGDITQIKTYHLVDFDLIHSNSVIEHVGNWAAVKKVADYVIASGKPYFIQTPNLWFPVEPHFRFVGWQWLPESWRAALLFSGPRGFFAKAKTYEEAMMHVESIKLLTSGQLEELFPAARIDREWLGPLVKSFMAVDPVGSAVTAGALAERRGYELAKA